MASALHALWLARAHWPDPEVGLHRAVTLTGSDPRTGHPLWFGLITAGVWGAPEKITPAYQFDPAHPPIPAGGVTDTEQFWYGYIFLPASGCYNVTVSWPGGGLADDDQRRTLVGYNYRCVACMVFVMRSICLRCGRSWTASRCA